MAVLDSLEGIQEFAKRIEWECNSLDDMGSLAYVASNKGYWYEAKEIEAFTDSMKQHIVAEFCEHPEDSRWYHEDENEELTEEFICDDCGAHSWSEE